MTSGYAIATLVVFIISIFFVIHPVSIPTPRHLPRIPINLTTAPILAIALLWAAQCIDPAVIRNGIVGTEGVKPYNILILFFTLAYMAITLDVTGILRAAAFWVSNKSGRNGWKLYLYFYVMFTLVSILIGNDTVILSGTAFLVYYTRVASLDPRAWIMAEFAAVNTASMVLFVGNPTNVVICKGFSVNNAAFTAYTVLPFVVCNVFCFAALVFQFRKQVPRKLERAPYRDPRTALRDPVSALVGCFMLGATLIICLIASFFGIDVWMISLPFAFAKFIFDLGWDYYRYSRGTPVVVDEDHDAASMGTIDSESLHSLSPPTQLQFTVIGSQLDAPKVDTWDHDYLNEVSLPPPADTEPPQPTVVGSQRDAPKVEDLDKGVSTGTRQQMEDSDSHHSSTATATNNMERQQSIVNISQRDVSEEVNNPESQTLPVPDMDTRMPYIFMRYRPYVNGLLTHLVKYFTTFIAALLQLSTRLFKYFMTFITALLRLPFALSSPAPDADIKTPYIFSWYRSYVNDLQTRLVRYFPTFITALPRLPFALVLFAFSQFILVEALNHQGWVTVFGGWFVRASHKEMHPTIWLVGILGVILCNLAGTNIGTTILLTQVVHAAELPYDVNRAAAIALAVSSNIGAVSFTFSASLTGLLWRAILRQKWIHVRQRDFAFWNLLPILVMTAVGLGVVSVEMAVLFRLGL